MCGGNVFPAFGASITLPCGQLRETVKQGTPVFYSCGTMKKRKNGDEFSMLLQSAGYIKSFYIEVLIKCALRM
jgi:hypothetical protein